MKNRIKTFFVLVGQHYDSLQEAAAAERKLIEAGYPLIGEYIEQYWINDSGDVVSEPPKNFNGTVMLAEQRNRLIDWAP